MPLTQDERALHRLAQELIELGELPRLAPKVVWAGNGEDKPCALCGRLIECKEVEYEVPNASAEIFRFHLRCHAIWQLALPLET